MSWNQPTIESIRYCQQGGFLMSSRGLNICTLGGNRCADPEIRQVERKNGSSNSGCQNDPLH